MEDLARYTGMLLGALLLAVITEVFIAGINRLRKRGSRTVAQPLFNKERAVRVLFVTVIIFLMTAITSR